MATFYGVTAAGATITSLNVIHNVAELSYQLIDSGAEVLATSDFNHYFHTDQETPATVPWTGLEASTRAYARIIDDVNKLSVDKRQRPPES